MIVGRCSRLVLVLGMLFAGASIAAPALGAQTHEHVDTTIVIRANGSALEFSPARISVKQGTHVRLRFINEGTLPHNVVIARSDDDIDALAMGAMQAGGDYVPLDQKDKMIAWTKLASPGQTVDVTFVVPSAGEYTYVCLFSGHAAMMLGTLRSLQ